MLVLFEILLKFFFLLFLRVEVIVIVLNFKDIIGPRFPKTRNSLYTLIERNKVVMLLSCIILCCLVAQRDIRNNGVK